MTHRTWVGTILIFVLAIVMLKVGADSRAAPLRSEHSEPAAVLPTGTVLVVDDGKVYHRTGCTYLHGRTKVVSPADAVRLGYTPCVRCLHDLLPR